MLIGVTNGILVHYVRIPAFIATFGIQGVAASLAQVITNGVSITAEDTSFSWLGQGKIEGVPVPVLLPVARGGRRRGDAEVDQARRPHLCLRRQPKAARLAGVNTARTTLFVYAASAMFAGLGGLITASRLMVGFPYVGSGNELFYSIAAAVVGGVSLFGGIGTIGGVLIGAVLIATVANGMNVMNVSSYWQPFVIGVIILWASPSTRTVERWADAACGACGPGGSPDRPARCGPAPGPTPAPEATPASPALPPTPPPDPGGPP